MTIGKPLNRTYTLIKNQKYRYLNNGVRYFTYQTDIDDFLSAVKMHHRNIYVANEQYFIDVSTRDRQWDEAKMKLMLNTQYFKWLLEERFKDTPEKKPTRKIRVMEDFILDGLDDTGWIAGRQGNGNIIDFTFKTLQGAQKLENNVLIKAVGIHAGFAKTIPEYAKYNRAKRIKLLFSDNYRGGIGKNQICYDRTNYVFNISDKQGLHLIYFKKPVSAKTVRFLIEDTYIGYDNITALNEVIFYTIIKRSM